MTNTGNWTSNLNLGLSVDALTSNSKGVCTMQASSSNNDEVEFGTLKITAAGIAESEVMPSYVLMRNGSEVSANDLTWYVTETLNLEAETTGLEYTLQTPNFTVGALTYRANKTTQTVIIQSNLVTEVTITYIE